MKKKSMFNGMALVAIALSLSACSDSKMKDEAAVDVSNFSSYVDSVNGLAPVYTETQWTTIDAGYQERVVKVDKPAAPLDDSQNAKVKSGKDTYAALKVKYETKIKEANDAKMAVDKAKQHVRDDLFGSGKFTPDYKWDFVTADNVVSVYENFVKNVREKTFNYTDEDWQEVRSLWKDLNDRKEVIDNGISTGDQLKITGLRVAYTAVKSVNRPVSKVREEVRENKNK